MLKLLSRMIALAAFFAVPDAIPQQTGSISGSVMNDAGGPLPGAQVFYNRVQDLRRDERGRLVPVASSMRSGVVKTDGTGKFLIPALPAGQYYLCAGGIQQNHLMSCDWQQRQGPVSLGAGQNASNLQLTVRTGTILRILIQDRASRIGSQHQLGVISATGHYKRAARVGRTGDPVQYALAVPKRISLRLFLGTPPVLRDETGIPLPVGSPSLPVTIGQESERTVNLVAP